MTTIKTLRAKQKEDTATTTSAVSRAEKAEKQLLDVKAQLKKANEIEKKNTERLKGMYRTEAANEALKREREAAQVLQFNNITDIGHYCGLTVCAGGCSFKGR
jgi:pyridoxine 5'-phosphate synthase PdxJ